MSDNETKVPLPNLEADGAAAGGGSMAAVPGTDDGSGKTAADLEAMFDVPVQVSAVLGRARMDVGELLKLGPGAVLELDRKVGEAIDIYVNNRLVARGEVVLVEDKLGVTMTEIIKADAELDVKLEAMRLLIVGTLKGQLTSRPNSRWTKARPSPMPTASTRRWRCCARAAAPTS